VTVTATVTVTVMAIDPDRLAALEEERRFLLRSLADLEREHDAGDVDEVDYLALRDGYVSRAAATMRAIDDQQAALPKAPPANWTRRLFVGLIAGAMIAVVWWALSASSAQRLPGQEITGADPRSERQVLLTQARQLQMSDPASSAATYALVLENDPENIEALTYRGWTLRIASMSMPDSAERVDALIEAIGSLDEAIKINPDYPDPYCFLGIIEGRDLNLPESAVPDLETCLAGNPPAMVKGLVEGLLEEMRTALDAP
jgi:tetratricopeptide (TPR) repeat protein